jgi:hypothetical protein
MLRISELASLGSTRLLIVGGSNLTIGRFEASISFLTKLEMVPVDGLLALCASELASGSVRTDCLVGGSNCHIGCFEASFSFCTKPGNGAGGRIRTADPRITNALLYHLSYTGAVDGGLYRKRLLLAMGGGDSGGLLNNCVPGHAGGHVPDGEVLGTSDIFRRGRSPDLPFLTARRRAANQRRQWNRCGFA